MKSRAAFFMPCSSSFSIKMPIFVSRKKQSPFMRKIFLVLFLFSLITSCSSKTEKGVGSVGENNENHIGNTIATRYYADKGYVLDVPEKGSFEYYLNNLPLLPLSAKAHNYAGEICHVGYNCGVVDCDFGMKKEEQCADAIIFLRANYLYKNKEYSKIHFCLTNGFNVSYVKWAEGYRVKVSGNKTSWYRMSRARSDYGSETFKKYLAFVYYYAGTYSLNHELKSVPQWNDAHIGDIIIDGGFPGHAEIIVAIERNKVKKNDIKVITAEGYTPAQQIEIVNPFYNSDSPWTNLGDVNDVTRLNFSNSTYTFKAQKLKRF
jgi:hypothetical protein